MPKMAHRFGGNGEILARLVPGPVRHVFGRSGGQAADFGRGGQAGQGFDRWSDAGQVPDGRFAESMGVFCDFGAENVFWVNFTRKIDFWGKT